MKSNKKIRKNTECSGLSQGEVQFEHFASNNERKNKNCYKMQNANKGNPGFLKKDMTFAELIKVNPKAAMRLAEMGLFCGGCPMAQFETIEQGAVAHGVDAEKLIKELNTEKK